MCARSGVNIASLALFHEILYNLEGITE